MAGAYSKTWSYRQDSLLAVYKKLTEVSPGTPKPELTNMMRAAVFLCKKALTDKVSSVSPTSIYLCLYFLRLSSVSGSIISLLVIHCCFLDKMLNENMN